MRGMEGTIVFFEKEINEKCLEVIVGKEFQ